MCQSDRRPSTNPTLKTNVVKTRPGAHSSIGLAIMRRVFPFVPKTTSGLVSLAFWHSLLLTVTTPLSRFLHRNWRGEDTIYGAVETFAPRRVTDYLEENNLIHPGIEYPAEGDIIEGAGPTVGIDRAFALHAGFSMLWLLVSYVQICHQPQSGRRHRMSGRLAILSFTLHVIGAVHNVYTDVVRHTALPKIILLLSLATGAVNLCIAVRFAMAGQKQKHKDYMVKCFMASIRGAGPIRQVANVQAMFGCGPILCQNKYGGMASQCQVVYVNRLLLTGLFSTYMFGMYVQRRNSYRLTQAYMREASAVLWLSAGTFLFSYYPQAENMVHLLFGEPRSQQATFFVLICIVLIVVSGVREYRAALSAPDSNREHAA